MSIDDSVDVLSAKFSFEFFSLKTALIFSNFSLLEIPFDLNLIIIKGIIDKKSDKV